MSPDFWWGFIAGIATLITLCTTFFVILAINFTHTNTHNKQNENIQNIYDLNERRGPA